MAVANYKIPDDDEDEMEEANDDSADDVQAPEVSSEAEGIRLHLSERNRTGYKGVFQRG